MINPCYNTDVDTGKKFFKRMKDGIKNIEKVTEVKDKVEEVGESIKEEISDFKEDAEEKISPVKEAVKEVGKEQLEAIKKEAQDMKRIFESKDIVFFKTDEMAIVLRKMGGLDEFLATVDKLTKQGYRLIFKEQVRDIPLPLGFKLPLGTFYYFQKAKYIT